MLRRLVITDFYDIKGNDYDIQFSDPLTILVGRNGSGKTTILNMISAVCQRRFARLSTIPFSSATLDFGSEVIDIFKIPDGRILVKHRDCVQRIWNDLQREQPDRYKLDALKPYEEDYPIKDTDDVLDPIVHRYRVVVPRRASTRHAIEIISSFRLTDKALYFPTYRRFELDLLSLLEDASAQVEPHMRHRVLFLQHELSFERTPGVVIGYSNEDIGQIVRRQWLLAAEQEKKRLNELLRSFTLHLLKPPTKFALPDETALERLGEELQEVLVRAEVIGPEQTAIVKKYTESVRQLIRLCKVLPVQSEVSNLRRVYPLVLYQTIAGFVSLWERAREDIETIRRPFVRLLSTLQQFFEKRVRLEEEDGSLVFELEGRSLEFESLSAGEKQLVALFTYVGLATDEGTIVLIDEPELSLHVRWQRQLLQSLLDLGTNRQFITSTHSPFIISRYRDATFQLGSVDE